MSNLLVESSPTCTSQDIRDFTNYLVFLINTNTYSTNVRAVYTTSGSDELVVQLECLGCRSSRTSIDELDYIKITSNHEMIYHADVMEMDSQDVEGSNYERMMKVPPQIAKKSAYLMLMI